MEDEKYVAEQRTITLDFGREMLRVLRSDADIMESVRDMFRSAKDEVGRSPRLFFEARSTTEAASGGSYQIRDDEIRGGAGMISLTPIGDKLMELVDREKKMIEGFVQKWLDKI